MMRIALFAAVAACFAAYGSCKSSATFSTCDTADGVVDYSIDDSGWIVDGGWEFIFRYDVRSGYYYDWNIQLNFVDRVTSLTPYHGVVEGSYNNGYTWIIRAEAWNQVINGVDYGTAMAVTDSNTYTMVSSAYIYNNYGSCINGNGGSTTTTTTTPSNEITSSPGSTASPGTTTPSSMPSINPYGPTGYLPDHSEQVNIQYTPGNTNGDDPYDYNEVLYKSILFYQAQRSGYFDDKNLVPWRGSSGLTDGCENGYCPVDLRGGWYDAGDFVKFGFPMAYSATVLAWGMIEFKEGYIQAGEWEHALDMLKWATDYFIRAHSAPNELYFQVGDGFQDHSYWGHPETMTMPRPSFKIDQDHPGSEVAAETAAALAAAFLVFQVEDGAYAEVLKQHAIELYNFADTYRGNYHESVPESQVDSFYKSWNGYDDELMWGAMWLYKATSEQTYLDKAKPYANTVGMNEFSWDSKGPGAMVLLSQFDTSYRSNLDSALNTVLNMPTTPGGLTYFSQWGTNRYAANYALIALMTAKMDGIDSSSGGDYYNYGKTQIFRMLGSGDGSHSYVVGFGNNPPQRPHHRSSSCHDWTSDPYTQDCGSADQNNAGPNPQILYGALVGGPGQDGSYSDDRNDYVKNEVATDYNAGFQSAVAGLKYFQ